jgi:transcriptional regulator with XRE-family HTH domain
VNRLTFYREKAGLTRKELANRCELSDTTIAKLESGIIAGPTLKNARIISWALKNARALKGEKGDPVDIVFPWEKIE